MATIAKTIKNKSGFMLALLFIFLIGAGPAVAKTKPSEKKDKAPTEKKKKVAATKKKFATTWYYISPSTTQSNFVVAGNWATTNNSESCITAGTRPCRITVDASNSTQLATYLSTQTGASVLAASTGRKE